MQLREKYTAKESSEDGKEDNPMKLNQVTVALQ